MMDLHSPCKGGKDEEAEWMNSRSQSQSESDTVAGVLGQT